MILRALYDFYNRYNAYNNDAPLPPVGFEEREIGYSIIIDKQGVFQRFESHLDQNDRGVQKWVMQYVERTSNAASMPNRLWDGIKYVLNIDGGKVQSEDLAHCKNFASKVEEIYSLFPDNEQFKAVWLFYKKKEYLNKRINEDRLFDEVVKSTKNLTFRLTEEDECVASHPDLLLYMDHLLAGWDTQGRCLITGITGPVVKTASIIQIPGGDSKGKLVSFNDVSFNSHGFNQMENAPISVEADSKIYNACKHLLKYGGDTNLTINSRTFVFWTSVINKECDNVISKIHEIGTPKGIFSDDWEWDDLTENPERETDRIKSSFLSVFSGKQMSYTDISFCLLGLTHNSSRDVVICWKELPLASLCNNILSHFQDVQICCAYKDKPLGIGVYDIIDAIALEKKDGKRDFPDNEVEKILISILDGTAYPYSMYLACLRRTRLDQMPSDGPALSKWRKRETVRAAIIRGFLIRNDSQIKLNIMLNPNEQNQGYLCGRLFAVLERVQELSNKDNGYKSTLRNRYFTMASTSPADIFVNLMNLSTHHHEKIDNDGWLLKLEGDIIDMLPSTGFPAHLSVADQGAFVVGYYHQRQAFIVRKETNND